MAIIAPSILSADFTQLGKEISAIEKAGADWIHIDVMDGRYVPNITIGPLIVEAARRATKLPLDVHLMIIEPEKWVDTFAKAGADRITVHAEATIHLDRVVNHIRSLEKKAGVSLNPSTPEDHLEYVIDKLDTVLVMTVNPGFGGQHFIASQLQKIERIAAMLKKAGNKDCIVEVDGGIEPKTAKLCADAGATAFVAGSAIFHANDYEMAIQQIRTAASK